jgi:hypothetical protein
MSTAATPDMNIKQSVPFFRISDVEHSVRLYMRGLGFTMKHRRLVDEKLRWCCLELGGRALMLQTHVQDSRNALVGKLGQGIARSFQCEDAVKRYRDFISRGLEASEPPVGNSMWSPAYCYRLEFEGPTDAPEETKL